MASSIFVNDTDLLDTLITRTRALILLYTDGLTALATGVESYTLDTGQSTITVRRSDSVKLQAGLDNLLNRYAFLIRQRDGGASSYAGAAW